MLLCFLFSHFLILYVCLTAKQQATTEKTLFWGLQINDSDRDRLCNVRQAPLSADDAALNTLHAVLRSHPTFRVSANMHCTMLFVGRRDGLDESKYAAMQGSVLSLAATAVVHDDKAIALVLNKTFPCANEHAHITVALADKVESVYSNEMIGRALSSSATRPHMIQFEKPIVLSGIVRCWK